MSQLNFTPFQKRLFAHILKREKVQIYTNEAETYENPGSGNVVSGHGCVDINVHIPFRLGLLHLVKIWDDVIDFVKEFPLFSRGFWRHGYKWQGLRLWWRLSRPSPSISGWIWVASSIRSFEWDAAEEIYSKKYQRKKLNSLDYHAIEALSKQLSRDQVINHIQNEAGYTTITPFLWVSESDPTCFVIDESKYPFDLKDGWSNNKLSELISVWFEAVFGKNIAVIYKNEEV